MNQQFRSAARAQPARSAFASEKLSTSCPGRGPPLRAVAATASAASACSGESPRACGTTPNRPSAGATYHRQVQTKRADQEPGEILGFFGGEEQTVKVLGGAGDLGDVRDPLPRQRDAAPGALRTESQRNRLAAASAYPVRQVRDAGAQDADTRRGRDLKSPASRGSSRTRPPSALPRVARIT